MEKSIVTFQILARIVFRCCMQTMLNLFPKNLFFSDKTIEKKNIRKDLWFHISPYLNWNIHIRSAISKALDVLIILKRSSPKSSSKPDTNLKLIKDRFCHAIRESLQCPNIEDLKLLKNVQRKCVNWIKVRIKRFYVQ